MSSSLYFAPVLPLYWLLSAGFLLLILSCWLESRKPYRFKAIRILAQAFAILALLGLLLRPSRDVNEDRAGLIVLTENFSQNALDSLVSAEPGLKVISLAPASPFDKLRASPEGEGNARSENSLTPASPEGEGNAPAARAGTSASPLSNDGVRETVDSYRELAQRGQIRFVVGDGIPVSSLEAVPQTFQYVAGPAPTGVVELNTTTYPEHRRVFLTGKVRGSKGSRLALRGPGGEEDSITIRTNALSPFELGFTTKVPGQYVYTLTRTDSTGRVSAEEIPIEVAPSRKLSVLMLQAYPQAEVRFLKNYLAEKGHSLVTRFQVSKNIFRYEVANGAKQPSGSLSAEKLEDFDLVVADNESLSRLSGEENGALDQAVKKGLGLLVLLEGMPDARKFPGSILQLAQVRDVPDTIRHRVGSFGSFTSPYVAVKAANRVQPLHRSGSTLLQGLVLVGEGKIAVQTLRETYRLALGGDNGAYAALWTPLLEKASRRADVPVKLRMTTPFPVYPGEPIDFEVIGPLVNVVAPHDNTIPLAEDLLVDDRWTGRFWAGDSGWGAVTAADSLKHYVFVSKPGSWKSLRAEVQRRENRLVSSTPGQTATVVRRKPIEPLIFFILFVLAAGFVWLAPKL